MASPLSEVISYLNFQGQIASGDEYSTIKVLLQEFGSLSVTVVSDENLNFFVEFSNDGNNFDYTNSSSIAENANQTITSVILGKWCRIRAINASNIMANVRFSTFCQVIPIATQSQIEAEGNNFPTFNVDNLSGTLFNEQKVSEKKPEHQHNFTYSSTAAGVLTGADRELNQISGGGLNPVLSPATVVDNTLTLSNVYASPAGSYQCVYGPPVVVSGGNPVYINLSAAFNTAGYTNGDTLGYDQMLVGMGYVDIATGNIIDGFYVGFPSVANPPATITDEFAFVIFADGVESHIVKSKWSGDRLDGNGPSRILLDESNLSTWRIRTSIVNSLYLEYHNPTDNVWINCHRVQFENLFNGTEILNPSYGYNVYTKRTSTATGLAVLNGGGPRSAQGVLGIEVGQNALGRIDTYSVLSPTVPFAPGVEAELFSIRPGDQINSITNRSLIVPKRMFMVLVPTTIAGIIILRVYKNGTFAGSTWVYRDAIHDSMQTETTLSAVVGTGYNIGTIITNGVITKEFDLQDYNSRLSRLETLTFTVTSSTALSVTVAVNYDLII